MFSLVIGVVPFPLGCCAQDEEHDDAFLVGQGYVADAPYHFTFLPWTLEVAVLACLPWEVRREVCNGLLI